MSNNYTLGRGKVYFGRHTTPGEAPSRIGELYFGNTPEFNINAEEEKLDHFNSDEGIREKDDSISLEVTRTGSLITDNINPENMALFFFGTASALVVAGGAVTDELIEEVQQGYYYQLGRGAAKPMGVRDLTGVTVTDTDTAETAYTITTDYTIDAATGRLYIVPGGGIANDADILVNYTETAHTRDRIVSGGTAISGSLHYIAANPKGTQYDFYMPYVQISPNGDFAVKGDEWTQIPFSVEILKLADYEALYIDGRAP